MHKIKLPLVLLPGLVSDSIAWQIPIRVLSNLINKIQVIVLDKDYRSHELVKYVLDKAPKKFILMGHSLGGWIALELMRMAPERVFSLILLNTTARLETAVNIKVRKSLIDMINHGRYKDVIENITPKYLSQINLSNKQLKQMVTDLFHRAGHEMFIMQQNAIINRPGSLDILSKIHCPSLIIHAKEDAIISINEQYEMLRIRNSSMSIINNCGHLSFLEQPHELASKIIYWLQSQKKIL